MNIIDKMASDVDFLIEVLSDLAYEGFCNQYGYSSKRACDSNCKECIREFLYSEYKERS